MNFATMNPLERSLIEKAGYANGWENVRESTAERVIMFSARHKAEVEVSSAGDGTAAWGVQFPTGPPVTELARSFAVIDSLTGSFQANGEAALGRLLRRAAELAMSLPNHAADLYAEEVAKIEAEPPTTTEALRMTKQRIGQNLFRQALMDYWGGACAVTGLHLSELLRASHAKPWADCVTDGERLDVFNGFLLSAQLDALFDCGLITFDDTGALQPSPRLDPFHRLLLGLVDETQLHLRWISPDHLPYLAWHREHVFQS
jgi:putative restriction endonuclease